MPDASDSPPAPAPCASRRPVYLTAGVVLLISLALRLAFAALVFDAHDSESFTRIHSDTREYVRLGERVKTLEQYTLGNNFAVTRGLVRPPGYPAFYAALDRLGLGVSVDLRRIVWPQAILVSLGPLAAYGIALLAFRHVVPATVVGLLSACSPTGWAVGAIAMPDGLFGTGFAIAFLGLLALCVATPRRTTTIAIVAGVALAIAVALKPAAMYWPIVALPALLIARGWNRRTAPLAVALLLPALLVVGGWKLRNQLMWHVPVYTIIDTKNLRYFVTPRVELEAELGRPPTLDEWIKRSNAIGDTDTAVLRQRVSWPTLPMILARHHEEARRPLREHPRIAARVMLSNLLDQLDSRWKKVFQQLPRDGRSTTLREWARAPFLIGDAPWIIWPYYASLLLAVPVCLAMKGRGPTLFALSLCLIAYAYVVLPTATVAYEGSRLLFAAEAMGFVLVVAPAWLIVERLRARRRLAHPESRRTLA